jgi:hypothetical protein
VGLEDCFCEEKIYVQYLECKTVIVCASRSVAGRRLVERENHSACATVDCKLFYMRDSTVETVFESN